MKKHNPLVKCACGCGKLRLKYDVNGLPRKYAHSGQPKIIRPQTWVECLCGCRQLRLKYDKKGRIRKYIAGHQGAFGRSHNKFPLWHRLKLSKARKGKKLSEQAKIKLTKWRNDHPELTRKWGMLGYLAVQNKKGFTSIEKKVYAELKNRGILFEKQKLINGRFLVDAYIPSLNLVIECDGKYWHSFEKTIIKDRTKNAYLKACNYNLLRLTEEEINNGNFKNRLTEMKYL